MSTSLVVNFDGLVVLTVDQRFVSIGIVSSHTGALPNAKKEADPEGPSDTAYKNQTRDSRPLLAHGRSTLRGVNSGHLCASFAQVFITL